MNKESKSFLEFIDNRLSNSNISLTDWKRYLEQLPIVYNDDLTFKLLFDWHWDKALNNGRAWFNRDHHSKRDPLFEKQVSLIHSAGRQLHDLDYQYRELIICHARCNLRGKKLLEIGGSLPNDLLFDHLKIDSYVNIESPDYIEAESGEPYTNKHGAHDRRKTIYCNAEDITKEVSPDSIDTIFSVACFEHIYDLPAALEACHACNKQDGTLYSYFAPIYSQIQQGDHGVIADHEKFSKKPIGLHLLSAQDQRKKLIGAGITDPLEIQDFLGKVNYDRVPNRLLSEDYERIITESSYIVLDLDRQDYFNLSKIYPKEFQEVRISNPKVQNMMAVGFRIHLLKSSKFNFS